VVGRFADFRRRRLQIEERAAAGGTGDVVGLEDAVADRLQDVEREPDTRAGARFAPDEDGVADAVAEQRADVAGGAEHGVEHVRNFTGRGRVKRVLQQDRVLGRNLRGEITKRHDGRERAAIRDGDDVGRMRVGEEIKRLAVARVDGDDRFLFEHEVGEEIAELDALVLDGCVGVERGADAGGERRAADGIFAERDLLRGAPGEDEGIEAERRLLGREFVLGVLPGEADQCARDGDFVDAVLGERDADGIADAVGQERADADGALDPAILAIASLGDAEVERVIPIGSELEQPRRE